jgi:hypothetical protein
VRRHDAAFLQRDVSRCFSWQDEISLPHSVVVPPHFKVIPQQTADKLAKLVGGGPFPGARLAVKLKNT